MERLSLHPSLVERVYAAIRDAICSGELPPGARLTQEQLAARLDVSRQPVLQALVLLKKQGFVREAGRRGVVVAPLDPVFVAQLYEVRAALDALASRAAAARRPDEARRHGPALIEAGRAAVRSGSVAQMVEADIRFHQFLYELSGNPLIAETAALHWLHIRRVMGGYLQRDRARDDIWDEHAAILAAVADGAPDRAERLAREHAETSARKLTGALATEHASNQDLCESAQNGRNAR
ncbi:MAG TPA: GntR family transcriptional regulator [Alphaproteobacteria bacterium]